MRNLLIIHGDLQQITIIAEIEKFGYSFITRKPMDFIICSKFDSEICAYLEAGENYSIHEKEPMLHELHGYQSDGDTVPLALQSDNKLPVGIYPLKANK